MREILFFFVGMYFNKIILILMDNPIVNRIMLSSTISRMIKYGFLTTVFANIYYDFETLNQIFENTEYVEYFTFGYIYNNFGGIKYTSNKDAP